MAGLCKTYRGSQIDDSLSRDVCLFVVIPDLHIDYMDGFIEVPAPGKEI